jgi:hypothetical protein
MVKFETSARRQGSSCLCVVLFAFGITTDSKKDTSVGVCPKDTANWPWTSNSLDDPCCNQKTRPMDDRAATKRLVKMEYTSTIPLLPQKTPTGIDCSYT